MKPSPPYLGLILASCHKLDAYISRGCLPSPHSSLECSDSDGDLDDEVTQAFSRMNVQSNPGSVTPAASPVNHSDRTGEFD